jgi:hypothetical protein
VSALHLRDELRLHISQASSRSRQLIKLRSAITSGDWSDIEHLTTSLTSPASLLYRIFRHRFHELFAEGDLMTALQFLSTHLREHRHQGDPGDFDKLCLSLVGAASPSHASQLPDAQQSTTNILDSTRIPSLRNPSRLFLKR